MNLIVEAPETESCESPVDANPVATDRRRIDVTELDAATVESYVRSNVATDRVCLEHRGGRTFLLVEE